MQIMDGKGALFFALPNFIRPRMNRISAFPYTQSWNHAVSTLAGTSITVTFAPEQAHFFAHLAISLPYGGLQNTFSPSQL